MFPESMAPPLENYEHFKAFMAERGVLTRREYLPETEDEETGEIYPAFWTVVISKEALCSDGKMWVRMMDFGEDALRMRPWEQAWEVQAELLDKAFRYMLEDAGVTVA